MDEKERYENPYTHEEYTDEEVRSLTYKYMDYKARHCVIACMAIPILSLCTLFFAITGMYVAAGVMGGVAICLILCDVFWIYRAYKKEEQRLKNKYGDEFLERATWFKKRNKD